MAADLDFLDAQLVDGFQRGFPLVPRPFREVARCLGREEGEVIGRYRALLAQGVVGRIGAIVAPNTIGASTLAAMRVPPADLERVAGTVSAEPGVSHNYEREHAVNLWFVVTGRDGADVAATLDRIRGATGMAVADLTLLEPFHLDLGFPLGGGRSAMSRGESCDAAAVQSGDADLLAAIEDGIPLVPEPFAAVAAAVGVAESTLLTRLSTLAAAGIVKRFGVVVRHRAVGYGANAMAVWDVPDPAASALGRRFAEVPEVTLAYRRRRAAGWPFNLYCMVHARQRAEALAVVERLDAIAGCQARDRAVLFSRRCFKQRGARFGAARDAAA